jgi:hypothetical protein
MSEIRADVVSDAAGTGPATLTKQYAAKAWVNFNGTGTVAVRDSGNVSSITDNGTGDYTDNFASAFADAAYAATSQQGRGTTGSTNLLVVAPSAVDPTVSTFRFGTFNSSFSAVDSGYNYLTADGDLA